MARVTKVDTVIKNAKLVTPEGIVPRAGLAINREKIVAVASDRELPEARRVIDAQGNYVMPGIIDPHTHPGAYRPFPKDIEMESKAGAAGGVTTMIGITKVTRMTKEFKKYTQPKDVVPYRKAFPAARKMVDELSSIDFGFNIAVQTDAHAAEILEFARESGVYTYKFYVGYKDASKWTASIGLPTTWDDGTLFYGMESIAKIGGVATFHAENNMINRILLGRVMKAGKKNLAAWEERSPDYVEAYDVNRVAYLSKILGTRIYPVHISSAMGLDECRRAKDEGVNIIVETCPHYLTINMHDPFPGELAKVNTPVRDKKNADALWAGLKNGDIDCIGSDHVPCYKKNVYVKGNIWKSLAGFPSFGFILPMMLSEGVNKGRISFPRLVEVMCRNTAKTFGFYPKKGDLRVGSDADVVIVDLKKEQKLTYKMLPSDCDASIYEGRRVKGWPILTMLRGEIIWQDGKNIGAPRGRYVPAKPTDRAA